MDLATASTFFDDQPVYDAYTGVELFRGQPDVYDLSKSDSAAGFRRTISSGNIVIPSRGCIQFGGESFLVGRLTRDFFQSENHRTYALLHPSDGLVSYGYPLSFLSGAPITAHAGGSWLKDRKFEQGGSDLRPEYTQYMSQSEAVTRGMLVKDTAGAYFRVQAVSRQTGGLLAVTAFDLGVDAIKQVSFVSSGAYDPVSDSLAASAPVLLSAFVEFFRANYHFQNNADAKFERTDLVLTVELGTPPTPQDRFIIDAKEYLVIGAYPDGWGTNSVHVRPVV